MLSDDELVAGGLWGPGSCVGDTVVEEGPLVSAKPLVHLTSKAVRASGRALWERSECSRVECADGRWAPGGQGAGPNVTRGELR